MIHHKSLKGSYQMTVQLWGKSSFVRPFERMFEDPVNFLIMQKRRSFDTETKRIPDWAAEDAGEKAESAAAVFCDSEKGFSFI